MNITLVVNSYMCALGRGDGGQGRERPRRPGSGTGEQEALRRQAHTPLLAAWGARRLGHAPL